MSLSFMSTKYLLLRVDVIFDGGGAAIDAQDAAGLAHLEVLFDNRALEDRLVLRAITELNLDRLAGQE